jgi:hypothetical protein
VKVVGGAVEKPQLARTLEAVAAIMEIDSGFTELSLEFEDGRLRRWGSADPRNSPYELAQFDEAARRLAAPCPD